MRQDAEQIVDRLLEKNWLRNRWHDIKAVTGIGHDLTGLGKNVEKGWKPKFGGPTATNVKSHKLEVEPKPEEPEKTWEIGML
jgi:hypothetical protein